MKLYFTIHLFSDLHLFYIFLHVYMYMYYMKMYCYMRSDRVIAKQSRACLPVVVEHNWPP